MIEQKGHINKHVIKKDVSVMFEERIIVWVYRISLGTIGAISFFIIIILTHHIGNHKKDYESIKLQLSLDS